MFSNGKPLSIILYVIGVVVIFLAVYIAYLVPLGPVTGYLVVYGIPIVVVTLIFGKQILPKAGKNNKTGFKFGLGLFSSFYLLGIFLAVAAILIISQFNPSVPQILEKQNPALDVPSNIAWIFIVVSLLVVGPAEEYLFRGFMFGGLLSLSKGKNWLPLAIVSSLMFAAAHGYYALTYGVASPVFFIELTTFGVAMAITFYWSGGNLLAVSVIHGLNDAIGFLGIATNTTVSRVALGIFVGVGTVFAVFFVLLKKVRINPTPAPSAPSEPEQLPPPLPPN
jgi:membrane protease YdiL (CAAX protease family)